MAARVDGAGSVAGTGGSQRCGILGIVQFFKNNKGHAFMLSYLGEEGRCLEDRSWVSVPRVHIDRPRPRGR